jgi:ABC-type transport system involved in cytochrome c biogenesis permease subunit
MGITHACFGLSYLAALGLELGQQYRPARTLRLAGLGFGLAGLIAHTIYLVFNHPSPATPYGSVLLLAWVFAIFYLYGILQTKSRPWALFVLPLVLILVILSFAFRYAFPGDGASFGSWFSADHFWGAFHGILLLAASVGITVGFLASTMYLIQSGRLKKKRPPIGGLKLFSLERLETMNRRAINIAFPLLTVGILLGMVRVPLADSTAANWTNVKVLGTALLWVIALLLLYLRHGVHLTPRRLSWLTLIAFFLMMFTLFAVHPFAGNPPVTTGPTGGEGVR